MGKKCLLCGDEFESNIKTKVFCKSPHPVKCHYCKKDIEKKPKVGLEIYTCGSLACRRARTEETNMKRYGVKNVAGAKVVKEKTKKTNIERYGTEHPFQSEKVKEKIKETNIERYGTENPRWHNEESRKKAEETNLNRYGSENPFGSKDIQEKIKETNLERYGVEWNTQSETINKKRVESYRKRYGVDNPAKAKKIQEKIKETNLARYGEETYLSTTEAKEKIKETNLERYGVENPAHFGIENYEDFINLEEFINSTKGDLSLTTIAKYFNINRRSLKRKVREIGLEEMFYDFNTSSIREDEVEEFLRKSNVEFIKNDRKVLEGKELDFYLPNENLAIEISPTFTHNSLFGWNRKGEGLPKNYHFNKFQNCKSKGINLITIFDWYDFDKMIARIKSIVDPTAFFEKGEFHSETITLDTRIEEKIKEWAPYEIALKEKRYSASILISKNETIGLAVWVKNKTEVDILELLFKPGVVVESGESELLEEIKRKNKDVSSIRIETRNDLGPVNLVDAGFSKETELESKLNLFNENNKSHKIAEEYDEKNESWLPVYDCGSTIWKVDLKKNI